MIMTKEEKKQNRERLWRLWRLQGLAGLGEDFMPPLGLLDPMKRMFDTRWGDQRVPVAWVEQVHVSGYILEAFTCDPSLTKSRGMALKYYPTKCQGYLDQLDRLQGLIDHLKGELRD